MLAIVETQSLYFYTMMFIHLHDVVFHAFHGVHAEEKLLGGDFVVNLTAGFNAPARIYHLDETVNYVAVYEIVKDRMLKPSALLETIAVDIAAEILAQFSIIVEVQISITKKHPPIPSFVGSVGVSYSLKR